MKGTADRYETLADLAHDLMMAAQNAHLAARREEAGEEPGGTDHLQDNYVDARLQAVARWER